MLTKGQRDEVQDHIASVEWWLPEISNAVRDGKDALAMRRSGNAVIALGSLIKLLSQSLEA